MAVNPAFRVPLDIANRALQHVGADRKIVSFTENSKEAREINLVYDKVREAEMRRNVWRFGIKSAAIRPITPTTMKFRPAEFSTTISYFPGAIVEFGGTYWVANRHGDLDNVPGEGGGWEPYFGPQTCDQFDMGTTYYIGELVYIGDGAGHTNVYVSLVNGNGGDPPTGNGAVPNVPSPWKAFVAATPTQSSVGLYNRGDVVQGSDGYFYMSLIDLNFGNDPTAAVNPFDLSIPYAIGDLTAGIDGLIYSSLVADNLGHNPTLDTTQAFWSATKAFQTWTPAFLAPTGSNQWLRVAGDATAIRFVYPLGTGPDPSNASRNVYHLPFGYLNEAPQDPKAGGSSFLGAPSGRSYDDWEYQDDFIISRRVELMLLRFVANITDVRRMDPMFCEGLAARIAVEVCEALTNSTAKLNSIEQAYQRFMTEARVVNGIETGEEYPAEDDYISCRM